MFFMYIHNHSTERCLMDQPQELTKMMAQMREEAQKGGVKVTAYSAPHEHAIYAVIEANDMMALEKVLAPMTRWGDATLTPVIPVGQTSLAQSMK